MRRTSLLLASLGLPLFASGVPAPAAGQVPGARAEARIVQVRLEPSLPALGELFRVHIDLRVPPGQRVLLPELLPATVEMENTGAGSWQVVSAPGDSIEVQASFPMVAYDSGTLDLPQLELWLQPAAAAAPDDLVVRAIAGSTTPPEEEKIRLWLGTADLRSYPPLEQEGAVLRPRPAAEVLGGYWSGWLVLAGGFMTALGLGGLGAAARRGWRAALARSFARLRGDTPRQRAIRELERIRSLAAHRDGRVDEFYASSTAAIRTFAYEVDPGWGPALTSSELVQQLAARWGVERTARLAPLVAAAEGAKFGARSPDPDQAELDWAGLRDWVRNAPEK